MKRRCEDVEPGGPDGEDTPNGNSSALKQGWAHAFQFLTGHSTRPLRTYLGSWLSSWEQLIKLAVRVLRIHDASEDLRTPRPLFQEDPF